MMSSSSDSHAHTNRLIHETSPYLLQHAHNPVDWHAWGPEAFEIALQNNKPLFMSVGYSTCYWCHVMERQSFENEAIAAEMNRLFVNIKVDREERPDVDQLYMQAVQMLTGQGGWPMSVFLLPDGRPFYGGTYFPPQDMHNRPGFPRLLAAVADAFANRLPEVEKSANQLVEVLKRTAHPASLTKPLTIDRDYLSELIDRSTSDFDPGQGGFGGAPKFPRQTLLELLLTHQRHDPNPARLKMVLRTLDAMADGGIHDHLGGAFHRYSTDDAWLVPHFEIMLYDNAMLAWVYAEAFAQTKEPRYAKVAAGIADFILREMTSPEGAFYTAFDAEVDAQEGQSYLWTTEEIAQLLGPDADLFNRVYGLSLGPNFTDPHHHSDAPEKNILFLPQPIDADLDARLQPMREKLYEHRRARKQPLLDTKILTSWNALMIRALAHVGRTLDQPKYLAAGERAAAFLLTHHRTPDGGLWRTSRDGKAKHPGFLDDYAFLVQALLALDKRKEAEELAKTMRSKFWDQQGGGFFFTASDSDELIVRQKTASDSPLPSGNAIATMSMLQLGDDAPARDTISLFAGQLERWAEGMSAMVQAAADLVASNGPLIVPAGPLAPTQTPSPVTASAHWNDPLSLTVKLKIANGWHTQSTRLSVPSDLGASVNYPPGETYSGEVEIGIRFASPPRDAMIISIQFQPCDQSRCLAPTALRLTTPRPPRP
jgi:uncharacterized protein